jgi:hypothetical protein
MGGRSSSSSNQATNTYNTDKRIANDGGFVAQDGGVINATIQSVDKDIISKALDTIGMADATNGESFGALLTLADKVITGGGELLATGQQQVLSSLQTLQTEKQGSIDNKTIVLLAAAGAAAYVLSKRG